MYRPLFPLELLVTGVLAASGSASPLPLSPYSQSGTHGGVGGLALDGGTLDVLRRSVFLFCLFVRCHDPRTLVVPTKFFSAKLRCRDLENACSPNEVLLGEVTLS